MSKTTNKFSPEVRSRAVRLVLDHEREYPSRWAAIVSVASKSGCTAQTLHDWTKKTEVDSGMPASVPTELRQANEILHKASAYSAQAELDRRFKARSIPSTIIAGPTRKSFGGRAATVLARLQDGPKSEEIYSLPDDHFPQGSDARLWVDLGEALETAFREAVANNERDFLGRPVPGPQS